jgi:hypothetical protein
MNTEFLTVAALIAVLAAAIACLCLDFAGHDGNTNGPMDTLYKLFFVVAAGGGVAMCAIGGALN